LGRRLLSMSSSEQEDSQPRAFPASYYRHFAGISQLEGMSERVLQSVEGRVCKIYNSMCSSLARAEPPNAQQAALWHRQVLSTYLRDW